MTSTKFDIADCLNEMINSITNWERSLRGRLLYFFSFYNILERYLCTQIRVAVSIYVHYRQQQKNSTERVIPTIINNKIDNKWWNWIGWEQKKRTKCCSELWAYKRLHSHRLYFSKNFEFKPFGSLKNIHSKWDVFIVRR